MWLLDMSFEFRWHNRELQGERRGGGATSGQIILGAWWSFWGITFISEWGARNFSSWMRKPETIAFININKCIELLSGLRTGRAGIMFSVLDAI